MSGGRAIQQALADPTAVGNPTEGGWPGWISARTCSRARVTRNGPAPHAFGRLTGPDDGQAFAESWLALAVYEQAASRAWRRRPAADESR